MNGLWRALALIPALLSLNALAAYFIASSEGDGPAASGFALTTLICSALAIALLLGERGVRRPSGVRAMVMLMLTVWLGTPVLAAMPLKVANPQAPFVFAYADAMAQFTTTGGHVLPLEPVRQALMYWRGSLQWMGGYFSILLALAVLAPLNLTGPGVFSSPLLTIRKGDFSERLGALSLIVAGTYGLASLGLLLWLLLAGAPFFQALIGMFGAISTGGILPGVGSFSDIAGSAGAWGGALGMLVGATSFAMHWELHRGRIGYFKDPETLGVLLMVTLAAALLLVTGSHFAPAVLNGISLATTYAAPMTPEGTAALPLSAVMAIVLVGGATLSTAGGVKIIRFLLLFRRTRAELFKLSHPSAVETVRFHSQIIDDNRFVNLWVYVLGYAGALGVVMVLIAAFGASFAESVNVAVAALSNAGPAFLAGLGGAGDFSHFSEPALLVLSGAMALGRFEILAVLVFVSPEFWRE